MAIFYNPENWKQPTQLIYPRHLDHPCDYGTKGRYYTVIQKTKKTNEYIKYLIEPPKTVIVFIKLTR